MKRDYIFSIIMPIYNTASYLEESVGSIVNQTIGFEEHIQLILVNDGSPDNAHEICTAFQEKYPDNIIYVSQKNAGVSRARNNGLAHATGKYVNFFDSDDIWEPNVFQIASDFFDAHADEVDAVCCLQKYFESASGMHKLSKKFKDGDRVVDIHSTPEHILLNVTSVFIKTEVAKRYQFDTEISIGEDSAYITEVIFEKEKYGVLQSAVYHIRKRHAGNSLTQAPSKTKYTKTMDRYYAYLPKLSQKKFGTVIPYVQYAMLNGLKYRVVSSRELPLTAEEKEIYIEKVTSLIRMIDDEVIVKAERIVPAKKLYLLRLKHGQLNAKDLSVKKNILLYKDIPLCNLSINRLTLYNLQVEDGTCTVTGKLSFPLMDNVALQLRIDDRTLPINLTGCSELLKYSITGDLIRKYNEFQFTCPLEKTPASMQFEVLYDGQIIIQKPILREMLTALKTEPITIGNKCISLKAKKILIEEI